MNEKKVIYLKGFLMGVCDLIPGISGGTIAFITGIYERLIKAIHNISPKNYLNLLLSLKNSNKFIKIFNKLDILFLIILFFGIFSAILIGSNLISFLLENYKAFLLSFFLGLILASSKIIYDDIKIHSSSNMFFGLIGFFLGLIITFLTPSQVSNPSFIYILIGGFLAIFALFLPGISGSFILLIMGLYEFIITSVKELKTQYLNLIPFAIGAAAGVFIISRLITWLFKKDKCKTLYFLLGLVLSTLLILIREINNNISIFNSLIASQIIILFGFGLLAVFLIKRL
ncbi:MAG: DUF368 domain-containing protein [Nanoarchaeota archaeon]|nr:DUF368 domain-containing protein [Nanoarchaeota archaeon]